MFRFSLSFRLGTLLFLFVLMIATPFICAAQAVEPLPSKSILPFFTENWAVIALVISEALALLPGKTQGIAQGILNVLNAIFKKKSPLKSRSS